MQELKSIIGIENVRKLSECFGGEYIYIPTLSHLELDKRNEEIKETFTHMLNEGSTCMNAYQSIADKTDLSVRWVQEIISKDMKCFT